MTTNNIIAGAAVTSPFWLWLVMQISEGAAIMLPILGCTWLAWQMIEKWRSK